MTEMRDAGVVAFVGSGFDCKSEALVAAAWNLPMIAFVSSEFLNSFPYESWNG